MAALLNGLGDRSAVVRKAYASALGQLTRVREGRGEGEGEGEGEGGEREREEREGGRERGGKGEET